jgi:hypothetical protein
MADQTTTTKACAPERAALTDLLARLPEYMGADVEAAVCAPSRQVSLACADVVEVAEQLGIDFGLAPFTAAHLHLGMEVEAEQRLAVGAGLLDEDMLELGRIAASNLQRQSDYYVRMTAAHAPGDPLPVAYHLGEVGTD